jgi:hypothetical protein
MSKSTAPTKSTGTASLQAVTQGALVAHSGGGQQANKQRRRAAKSGAQAQHGDVRDVVDGSGDRSTLTVDRSELHYGTGSMAPSGQTAAARHTQPNLIHIQYENTYRMEPQMKFDGQRVKKLVGDLLTETMTGRHYNAADCKWLSQELSETVLDRVKVDTHTVGLRRYKFVAVVSIGSVVEKPGVLFAGRCLWTPSTDNFVSASFSNDSLYAVVEVYAVYFE